MRVFLADDSAILRQRLTEMLSEIQGITVVGSAANARGAIDQIRKVQPDVVLFDTRLQGGSGLQILQSIKNRRDHSPVAIVLTNDSFPQYQKKYSEAGADYFFDKSTEFDEVRAVLKRLIKIRRGNEVTI